MSSFRKFVDWWFQKTLKKLGSYNFTWSKPTLNLMSKSTAISFSLSGNNLNYAFCQMNSILLRKKYSWKSEPVIEGANVEKVSIKDFWQHNRQGRLWLHSKNIRITHIFNTIINRPSTNQHLVNRVTQTSSSPHYMATIQLSNLPTFQTSNLLTFQASSLPTFQPSNFLIF